MSWIKLKEFESYWIYHLFSQQYLHCGVFSAPNSIDLDVFWWKINRTWINGGARKLYDTLPFRGSLESVVFDLVFFLFTNNQMRYSVAYYDSLFKSARVERYLSCTAVHGTFCAYDTKSFLHAVHHNRSYWIIFSLRL